MSNGGTRQFTADFFCFCKNEDKRSEYLKNLLEKHVGGHAPATALEDGSDEKYQIRSIRAPSNRKVYMAVFGRSKYGEVPEQATETGDESDVELKPDHGLVQKNHFLFYPDLNLVVFQRNGTASRYTHMQRYLNRPTYKGYVLEPVLTRDSYQRLSEGGEIKKVELSLLKPTFDVDQQSDQFLSEVVNLFGAAGAERMKITVSANRNRSLLELMRTSVPKAARHGRARVARVTMKEDNEIIDLIADRISQPMQVTVGDNGRPIPRSVFEELARAKDARKSDLQAFFG